MTTIVRFICWQKMCRAVLAMENCAGGPYVVIFSCSNNWDVSYEYFNHFSWKFVHKKMNQKAPFKRILTQGYERNEEKDYQVRFVLFKYVTYLDE